MRIVGSVETLKNNENLLLYSSWAASLFSTPSSYLNYCEYTVQSEGVNARTNSSDFICRSENANQTEVTCGERCSVSVGPCVCELLHVRIRCRRSIAELSLFMTVLALGSAQQNSQGSDDMRAQISSPPVSCRKKLNMKS